MSQDQISAAESEGMPGLPEIEMTKEPDQHAELMEVVSGIFVQISRCYDVLMAMLPDEVEAELDALHQTGRLAFSPPALLENAWTDEVPDQEKSVEK